MVIKQERNPGVWGKRRAGKKPPLAPEGNRRGGLNRSFSRDSDSTRPFVNNIYSPSEGDPDAIAAAEAVARAIAKKNYDFEEGSFNGADLGDDKYRLLRTISTLSSFSRHQYVPSTSSMTYSVNSSTSSQDSKKNKVFKNPLKFSKNRSYSSYSRHRDILNADKIKYEREPPQGAYPTNNPEKNQHLTSELQAYKKEVKGKLKNFDQDFKMRHGRMPTDTEKEPVRYLYEMYNIFKNELALREQEEEPAWAPSAAPPAAPVPEIAIDSDYDKDVMDDSFSDIADSDSDGRGSEESGSWAYRDTRDTRISPPRRARSIERPIPKDALRKRQTRRVAVDKRVFKEPVEVEERDDREIQVRTKAEKPRRKFHWRHNRDSRLKSSSKSPTSRSGKGRVQAYMPSNAAPSRSLSPGRSALSKSSASTKSRNRKKSMFSFRSKSRSLSSMSTKQGKSLASDYTSASSSNRPRKTDVVDSNRPTTARKAPISATSPKPKSRDVSNMPSTSPLSPVKSILLVPKYSKTADAEEEPESPRPRSPTKRSVETIASRLRRLAYGRTKRLVPDNYDIEIGVDGIQHSGTKSSADYPPPTIEIQNTGMSDVDEGVEVGLSSCGVLPRLLQNENQACQSTLMNCDAVSIDSEYDGTNKPDTPTNGSMEKQLKDSTYDFFDRIDSYLNWDRRRIMRPEAQLEEADDVSELSFT